MKKAKNGIRIAALLCAALGWWGLLYPELTLTPDTVRIVSEETGDGKPATEEAWSYDEELYLQLLNAGGKNIRFRSRLLTELKAFWEAHSWDKSTED